MAALKLAKNGMQGLKNLRKRLEALNKAEFSVGYYPENGIHSTSGLSYAGLFAIQSFGAPSVKIPPRPILDLEFQLFNPIRTNKKLKKLLTKYLSGINKKNPPVKLSVLLEDIAGDYVQKVRQGFGDTSKLKSNSDFTQRMKEIAGVKGNNPLVWTGDLRDNLSYSVSTSEGIITPS